MKKLISNSHWVLIVILVAFAFFYIRTVTSDGAFQFGEILGLVSIGAAIVLTWFIVRTEWWKELNQRFNITRIFSILFILALVIAVAIFYIFFGGF